jgi:ATP-dependent RNA helicase DDX52/ROK1
MLLFCLPLLPHTSQTVCSHTGMDFVGVNTVINYDFPATTADYIHRVGRTGRAGHSGLAVTFFSEHDAPRLRSVAHLVTQAGSKVKA